ncbi:MAG TPA: hypothetical protein PKA37_08210, partial [Planctomycetota bacterium]|nr:hypothetical protein [Planctomycetota bacterium]
MRAIASSGLSGLQVLVMAILLSGGNVAPAQNINGTPIRMDVGPTGALPANPWACGSHHSAAVVGGRAMSSDGEYVLIEARCPLDPTDTNGLADLYIFSRTLGTTELITRAWHGGPTTGSVNNATISGDGRYVAYQSSAPDILPPGVPHGLLYFLDRATGQTVPIDVTSTGAAPVAPPGFQQGGGAPHISADGSYVVYIASAPNLFPQHNPPIQRGFLRWSRITGQTELVNYAVDGSAVPNPGSLLCTHTISADGERILFCGQAFEYVPLPLGAPGARHVLMRDMVA